MTATRKLIPALLLLLASWNGQALAHQAPPAERVEAQVVAQEAETAPAWNVDDRLAWQRVGSPFSLEA